MKTTKLTSGFVLRIFHTNHDKKIAHITRTTEQNPLVENFFPRTAKVSEVVQWAERFDNLILT